MGNGILIYGGPMTWEEVCILVQKYLEKHPEALKREGLRISLLRLDIQETRDPDEEHPEDAKQEDLEKAESLVKSLTEEEMVKKIQSIIGSYFVNKVIDWKTDRGCELKDRIMECLFELLEVQVYEHGRCCIDNEGRPFFIGQEGDGGLGRGDASGIVELPDKASCKFVDKIFALVDRDAYYHIVADECDSCS